MALPRNGFNGAEKKAETTVCKNNIPQSIYSVVKKTNVMLIN